MSFAVRSCTVVVDKRTVLLCWKPYRGHARGCPNWKRKAGCPPGVRPIRFLIDLERSVYVAVNEFDLEAHCRMMAARHPGWSPAQCTNIRHWQATAWREWRKGFALWRADNSWASELLPLDCAEAARVNLTATCKTAGIVLEWPGHLEDFRIVRQVVLLGYPTEEMKGIAAVEGGQLEMDL
jgi:predicted metal-binding protein